MLEFFVTAASVFAAVSVVSYMVATAVQIYMRSCLR